MKHLLYILALLFPLVSSAKDDCNTTALIPSAGVAGQLGSGRGDLWVFGRDEDKADGSRVVQLCAWEVPIDSWGIADSEPTPPRTVLYSERPRDWAWKDRPARQLRDEFYYHLSKYDDHSAFSPIWGCRVGVDNFFIYEGAILRYENGHLSLIADGLKQARLDYDLADTQNFLGMVGDKIFYFDSTKNDRIFYFVKGHRNQLFEAVVPMHPLWPRSWKLEEAEQVFCSNKPDQILVYVWAHNHAWFSFAPRRDSSGLTVDLKKFSPVSSR